MRTVFAQQLIVNKNKNFYNGLSSPLSVEKMYGFIQNYLYCCYIETQYIDASHMFIKVQEFFLLTIPFIRKTFFLFKDSGKDYRDVFLNCSLFQVAKSI